MTLTLTEEKEKPETTELDILLNLVELSTINYQS